MKKLLLLILITLLLALSFFVIIEGVDIGSVKILGIKEIQEENSKLDEKIQQAGKLAEKDYTQAVSDVQTNAKKLKEEKQNYEDMTSISAEGDVQTANQIEKYEIETLWVRLGNHATSQGVVMQMDVLQGSNSAKDVYNLKFTATGSYICITDFISAIENDSTLGFKIEEFKMVPENGDTLKATFVCKDIMIQDVKATTPTPKNDQNGDDSNSSNTTNTGNTSNTSNAANTTNTGNTANTTGTANVSK